MGFGPSATQRADMARLAPSGSSEVFGTVTEEKGCDSQEPRLLANSLARNANLSLPPTYSEAPSLETRIEENDHSNPRSAEAEPWKTPSKLDTPDTEAPPSYSEAVNASSEGRDGRQPQPSRPGPANKVEAMAIKQILAHLGGVFPMDEAVIEGEL